METELTGMEARVEQVVALVRRLRDENIRLRQDLAVARDESGRLNQELAETRARHNALENRVGTALAQLDTLVAELPEDFPDEDANPAPAHEASA